MKSHVINKKDFADLCKYVEKYDSDREVMIKQTRNVLKLSKQIINAVNRGQAAKALVDKMKETLAKVNKIGNHKLFSEGFYRVAVQEYVEAVCYYHLEKNGRLPTSKELNVDPEHYLLGVCDLSGEMVRKAVNLAIKGKYSEVVRIKDFVDSLYFQLSKFDFRNSDLRKKYDAVRWDLKRIEDLVLELKMRGIV
ncbi:hypothetical protein D6745_05350 [Candidatus Woesearchaeota archaeon]|nr:MAG: hypothetical protein D6745_05350 [Candidatus Woesearchaeota archaeon]